MTSHRFFRCRLFVGVTLFLLLALCFRAVPAFGAEARDGIDAILVIDTSGSMRESDRERTAIEAAQLFIDMMETRNSRIGIVEFTDVLHTVIPLSPVNTPQERDALRRTISGFQYGGWTDIGLALRTAAEMMIEQGAPNNSPMILLFTDGAIELSPAQDIRTAEMSYQDVEWSLNALGGEVPIYTIGLNYHGDVDVAFLRRIAEQTTAHSFIIDEAAGLPLIISEIFANHIRSSLTEIAEFIAEEDEYVDIIIPIPSGFVAEANIIMLSDNPLLSVRLADPSGQQVEFDGVNHMLTYANRYSMIKSINPAVGDWVLSVMGLPDDRITVNLIYNFDLNISVSLFQDNDLAGPLNDPTQPVTVTASFIFADQRIQPEELYPGSVAELRVFDGAMQLQYAIPMVNTGDSFTVEYLRESDLDVVHLSVFVQHPHFEISSAYVTASFAEVEDLPEPEPSPEPTPEPEPTPSPEPTPEPPPQEVIVTDEGEGRATWPIILLILAVLGFLVLFMGRRKADKLSMFSGYLEVRAQLEDGMYTALEAPDLSTFPGRTTLYDFLSLSLKSQSSKILQSIDLGDVYIEPATVNGEPAIQLQNKGNCQILDDYGNTIDAKKPFNWYDNTRLVFTNNETSKLEVTYRATDD